MKKLKVCQAGSARKRGTAIAQKPRDRSTSLRVAGLAPTSSEARPASICARSSAERRLCSPGVR